MPVDKETLIQQILHERDFERQVRSVFSEALTQIEAIVKYNTLIVEPNDGTEQVDISEWTSEVREQAILKKVSAAQQLAEKLHHQHFTKS